jgi:16S rRNA (guanine527-N7)-methyltransferase
VIDSLAAAPALRDLGASLTIADLGSGAGLPGVPLAVVLRPARMVLVEARRRRASFLRNVARCLPAAAIEVANCRIEAFIAREDVQGAFDAVVTRATLTAAELLRASAPLVRHGGLAIAYRGPHQPPAESTSSAEQAGLHWRVEPSIRYRLPGHDRAMRLDIWRAERAPQG